MLAKKSTINWIIPNGIHLRGIKESLPSGLDSKITLLRLYTVLDLSRSWSFFIAYRHNWGKFKTLVVIPIFLEEISKHLLSTKIQFWKLAFLNQVSNHWARCVVIQFISKRVLATCSSRVVGGVYSLVSSCSDWTINSFSWTGVRWFSFSSKVWLEWSGAGDGVVRSFRMLSSKYASIDKPSASSASSTVWNFCLRSVRICCLTPEVSLRVEWLVNVVGCFLPVNVRK